MTTISSTDNALGKVGTLPNKIEDITTSISKGAEALDKMVDKMDNALKHVETHNPVSGAVIGGLSKMTGALDKVTDKLVDKADTLISVGKKVSQSIQPWCSTVDNVQKSAEDLKKCQDIVSTSALVVNAMVDSCSGHFHPRANEQVLTTFDNHWDSWAKTINGIYSQLSPSGQANILESLAKGTFGDNVFYLGSAIKNESAGIFGGIADFEDALHVFRGSYRNPIEAAKKIEKGVKAIVNATERVANSINNMILTYQKGMGQNAIGNPILSYIGNLHNTKAIATVNKILTLGGGAATIATDVSALGSAMKSKNPTAIYQAGKKTIDDIKTIGKGLKDTAYATKTTELSQNYVTGGAANVTNTIQSAGSDIQDVEDTNVKSNNKQDEDDNSVEADSYVCSGAVIKCTFGDKKAKLTVYPDRTVFLTGQPMANITDHTSLYNIASFGKCHTTRYPATGSATAANHGHLTPMPCIPGTVSNWINGKSDYLIKGKPALLKSSYCKCQWGGIISIVNDGQIETGPADGSRELRVPIAEWYVK